MDWSPQLWYDRDRLYELDKTVPWGANLNR